MSISFKPTTYNTNMFTLTPIEYSFKCVVSSLDRVGRKNVLNIVLGDEDLQLVANIEYEIRNKFERFTSCLEGNKMNGICIPTQYNHIRIPFKTIDALPVLPEHISEGVELVITLSPSKVIRQQHATVCTWLCKELIANIKYT